MAGQLQLRRGTNAQNAAFTGAQGELTMDTTNNRIVVHDGVTAGGHSTANTSDINDSTIFFDDDTAGGSVADAYILTPKTNSRTPASYFDGLQIGFVTANNNTGASTADFAGLGPKNIKTSAGADPSAASVSGRVELVYDAGNDWLELKESNLSQSEEVALKSGRENVVNNSRFQINSLGLSGVVALSAGESAHDGWVAGSSGCTYTFATTLGVTTLTITAGTLTQVVSGDRFLTGDYVLSWDGTAQARIDAGSYGNSGTVTASLSGGTPATIEFNTGTVTKAQLEQGAFSTDYQVKRESVERLEMSAGSFASQLLHVRDEKSSGTTGGNSSAGINTRDLNTVKTNEISGASLLSDQITLPAGSYFIEASAPGFSCGTHKLTLYNVTDGAYEVVGTSEFSSNGNTGSCRSLAKGRFTVTGGSKSFELRHDMQTGTTNGLGRSSSLASAEEVYTDVMIWRLN